MIDNTNGLINALEIINLKKTYVDLKNPAKSVEAVKGVSFEIKAGEIFGLLGPNGAGKTTLISTITTLEKPTSGEIKVFGISAIDQPMKTKKNVGVVHQEVINTGFFDVNEILDFQSGYYGIKKNQDRINYLLDRLSLKVHAEKKIKQLSGGMKRRLMIAKALVHSPKLLLLDEPTAGVDVELRESLWKFVGELKKDGVSVLLTTHYLEEAENLCDRIAIINAGEIHFCGTPVDVIGQFSTKKVKIKLIDNSVREFSVTATTTMKDIFTQNKISLDQVVDIQTSEGKLEEAFTQVLKGGRK